MVSANRIVPPFDFTDAARSTSGERIAKAIARAREVVEANGYQRISRFPCVPTRGASEWELAACERELQRPLPPEYRQFLAICRYLKLDDGCEVGGLSHEGSFVTERPWISAQHRAGNEYLVFANYWRYADGDQLMFDVAEPEAPVVAYLHEHGPLIEAFAPSFSFALWRLVHEASE